jgi:hypothetical protein
MECSKKNGRYIADHISDDGAFEHIQQASTSNPYAKANEERKRSKNNGHCTTNYICDGPLRNNPHQQGKESNLRANSMHLRRSAQNNNHQC